MNIDKIFGYIDVFSKRGYIGLGNNMMKSKRVIKFIQDFLSDPSPSTIDLDRIKLIIMMSKSVYDLDEHILAIPDELYDTMLSKYKKFRDEPFAISTMVGLSTTEYKYPSLAGTLDKAHHIYNTDVTDDRISVEEWVTKHARHFKNGASILVSFKIDGASIASDIMTDRQPYIAGSMSRGKLDYGEGGDVSIITNGLVFTKVENARYFNMGIQYEFAISDEGKRKFEKLMNRTFANHRSAAVGLMRRMLFADKHHLKEYRKMFSLVPVGFEIPGSDDWLSDFTYVVENMGYGDVSLQYQYNTFDSPTEFLIWFDEYANQAISERESLDYAIDGLVITFCDADVQKEIGRSGNINKYQLAYKFPEKRKRTRVLGMQITTGNFGYKELMVDVNTVVLNGTNQSKGQVHSIKKFDNLNLHIGDECFLKLSGDVIPFLEVDETCARGNGPRLKLPTHCDSCGAELIIQKDKFRCINSNCDLNRIGKLVTFVNELNAKGIGFETIKQLYNDLHVSTIPELLELEFKDFIMLDGFADESAANAAQTIEDIKSKPRTHAVVLSSLGIDELRTSTAEKILDQIPFSELMLLIDLEDADELERRLKQCKGVDKKAEGYARELISLGSDYINTVFSYMTIKAPKDKVSYDKTILVSGFRNDEYFEIAANLAGYDVKYSGSKSDLVVIANDSYRSKPKAMNAIAHGIPVMTRDEFLTMHDF